MAIPGGFGSVSLRKNVLKILLLVLLFHIITGYFLPSRVPAQRSTPESEDKTAAEVELERVLNSGSTSDESAASGSWSDRALSWISSQQAVKDAEDADNDAARQAEAEEDPEKKLAEAQKAAAADLDEPEAPKKSKGTAKDTGVKLSNADKESTSDSTSSSNSKSLVGESKTAGDKSFFRKAVDIFLKNKPECEKLELNDKAPSYYYIDLPNPTFTIDFLSTFLKIDDVQLKDLKAKHDQLKLDINDFEYPRDTFSGKGVVMIGGGAFLGTALTAIRALRETGSELPLQLMLTTTDEYDEDVCEKLLPKMNAKCMIMEEIVGSETFRGMNLQKYELKVLGLFLSTFEEVLLLDADNLAVKNPDYILDSKPYKEFGYVIWPDFWRQTISPKFYDIAGINIGEPVRKDGVPPEEKNPARSESQLSDLDGTIPDSTCEAGQLAINKKLHHKSLMATVYYNLFGFKYYYWLLGQGAVGIGDKDTFIAGLTVFREPYYFVKQRPLLFGYDHAGGWQDTTMVQYDPEQDYEYYTAARDYLMQKGIDSRVNLFLNWEYTNSLRDEIHKSIQKTKPEVQFLHIHSPKFNALKNYQGNDYEIDGHERRQFGDREKIKDALPLDWELKASRISQWLACDAEIIPKDWKEVDRSEICNRIKKHVEWLIQTSDSPEMAELKDIGV
ncbi:CYFA0S05e04192g1_1 [Cyberlindnera fabianii]|uniref:CYFA0S05e04192g1_1 n=1 Tax=Cyberlindnera fabianii TaxID=36022 RepID=A0A061AUA4_CYBFA|nr:CYFA0S05e04192g1_1 [Cyberlindnera fabianii]